MKNETKETEETIFLIVIPVVLLCFFIIILYICWKNYTRNRRERVILEVP